MKRSFGFTFGKPSAFDTDGPNSVFGESEPVKRKRPEELLYGEDEKQNQEEEEEEIDPLDAFMMGVEKQVKEESVVPSKPKAVRTEFEEEDMIESLMKHVEKEKEKERNKTKETGQSEDLVEEIEYDSDDNPVVVERSRTIDALPPLDHAEIDYPPFSKCFYEEHPDIAAMPEEEVANFRKIHDIRVSGEDVMRPVVSFAHFGFDEPLMNMIRKYEFTEPTAIQRQAVVAALSGRDVLGIAKTGSGKTLAFLWPMLVHIMDQPELEKGDGPIAVCCAPTRELAQQIYVEAKKYAKAYGLNVAAIYGGVNKFQQSKQLHQGCEIVIATPGRLIDMIKMKATSMRRVTYLVLDEADRMFDMGFEPQVRSIVGQIRPDRQTLLFSATFKKSVEQLAYEILDNPIRITVGNIGEANADVQQVVEVFNDDSPKWGWLVERLHSFTAAGSVLIFVSTKKASEELAANLNKANFQAGCIHGDKLQGDRTAIMQSFKNRELPILVATDVAARGLDVKHIKTVVNYDSARDINAHIHRIGRTGRAGSQDGVAYSLITKKEVNFAGHLVINLEGAKQVVPPALLEIATQNSYWRKMRERRHGAVGHGRGDFGGGRGRGGEGTGRGRMFGRGRGLKNAGIGFVGSSSPPPPPTPTSQSPAGRGLVAPYMTFRAAAAGGESGSWSATYKPPMPQTMPQQEVYDPTLPTESRSIVDKDKERAHRDSERGYSTTGNQDRGSHRSSVRDREDRERARDRSDRDSHGHKHRDRDHRGDHRSSRDRDGDRDRHRDRRTDDRGRAARKPSGWDH